MLAWCTWYIELAHSANSRTPCDVVSHLIGWRLKAQDLSLGINISIVIQVRTSLSRLSLSTSTCSSLSSFLSTSCTPSCTLSSTTWSSCKAFRNQFSQVQHWSDDRWKACLAAGGGEKKDISVLHWQFRTKCWSPSSSRTLRTQSLDPSLQENVII